jgi:hypothetical protein
LSFVGRPALVGPRVDEITLFHYGKANVFIVFVFAGLNFFGTFKPQSYVTRFQRILVSDLDIFDPESDGFPGRGEKVSRTHRGDLKLLAIIHAGTVLYSDGPHVSAPDPVVTYDNTRDSCLSHNLCSFQELGCVLPAW